jgi:hypothetical protein
MGCVYCDILGIGNQVLNGKACPLFQTERPPTQTICQSSCYPQRYVLALTWTLFMSLLHTASPALLLLCSVVIITALHNSLLNESRKGGCECFLHLFMSSVTSRTSPLQPLRNTQYKPSC